MICIIALVVFGILAIFSARHRPMAKEALDCVLRRISFRKCESRLDVRLKGELTGKIMRTHPGLAKFVFNYFEWLSWAFIILTVLSLVYTGIGGYNFYKYGNCNGKVNGEDFCIFDPAGKGKFSGLVSNYTGPVVLPSLGKNPTLGPADAKVEMIEFGCYMCPFTKKAEPTVKMVLQAYEGRILFTFRDFPITEKHEFAELHSLAARCSNDQDKYWEFRDFLFEKQGNMSHDADGMKSLALEFGLDMEQFNECMDSKKHIATIEEDVMAGIKAGVYGTPTFFINNRTLVGPQDFEKFEKIIEQELAK
ncbi:DsbA family protein [Candidatus Woesearchaeota archaeon]|nr:DsbA family protein [Candidatus Woesearchaeota archaeon]